MKRRSKRREKKTLVRSMNEKESEEKNFNTRIIMKFKPTDYGKPLLKIIIIIILLHSSDAKANRG